jgi:hypothetical protein
MGERSAITHVPVSNADDRDLSSLGVDTEEANRSGSAQHSYRTARLEPRDSDEIIRNPTDMPRAAVCGRLEYFIRPPPAEKRQMKKRKMAETPPARMRIRRKRNGESPVEILDMFWTEPQVVPSVRSSRGAPETRRMKGRSNRSAKRAVLPGGCTWIRFSMFASEVI